MVDYALLSRFVYRGRNAWKLSLRSLTILEIPEGLDGLAKVRAVCFVNETPALVLAHSFYR